MTAALSAEVSENGILANCVGPGFIDTDMTRTVLGEKGTVKIGGVAVNEIEHWEFEDYEKSDERQCYLLVFDG